MRVYVRTSVRPGQSRPHLDLQHIWRRLTDHFGSEIVPRFGRVALQVCGDPICLAGPGLPLKHWHYDR